MSVWSSPRRDNSCQRLSLVGAPREVHGSVRLGGALRFDYLAADQNLNPQHVVVPGGLPDRSGYGVRRKRVGGSPLDHDLRGNGPADRAARAAGAALARERCADVARHPYGHRFRILLRSRWRRRWGGRGWSGGGLLSFALL